MFLKLPDHLPRQMKSATAANNNNSTTTINKEVCVCLVDSLSSVLNICFIPCHMLKGVLDKNVFFIDDGWIL